MKSPLRRFVSLVSWVGPLTCAALTLSSAPSCMTHDCEPAARAIPSGSGAGEGDFINSTLWESTPLDGTWLDFHGGAVYDFEIPEWVRDGRPILDPHGYVSPAQSPNKTGDNWTEGIGNLVEYSALGPGKITVTNATCSQFYLRLILKAGPPPPPPDAGAD